MTIDEKLNIINSAYNKITARRANDLADEALDKFTDDEYAVIAAALDVAAGICALLREKRR